MTTAKKIAYQVGEGVWNVGYKNKQLEVYAVKEAADWLTITIITRYF